MIDLRSDTLTKPTPAMREAMWGAEIGDDVFEEDPTVNKLEETAARLFGMEAALFVASGTMANQLAIRLHTVPGSEVICDGQSHIYLYEGGGIMSNSLASVKLLEGDRGRLNAAQIREAMEDDHDVHTSETRLVSLENTMNKGGGSYYDRESLEAISTLCRKKKIALHLDGARLFNALVETKESPELYGGLFDTINICLSKGLGCPVGSLLLGTKASIRMARRYRKAMGGGWRQAGFLAAAGLYALSHHIERLKDDHRRAGIIGEIMNARPEIDDIYPVSTNIVIVRLQPGIKAKDYVAKLAEKGIRAVVFGEGLVRFVTHLDFTDDHLQAFDEKMRRGAL